MPLETTFWIPKPYASKRQGHSSVQLGSLIYNVLYNSPLSLGLDMYINDVELRRCYQMGDLLPELIQSNLISFVRQYLPQGPQSVKDMAEHMHRTSGRNPAFPVEEFLCMDDLEDLEKRARIVRYDHSFYSEAYSQGIIEIFTTLHNQVNPILPTELTKCILDCLAEHGAKERISWAYVDRDERLGSDICQRLSDKTLWARYRHVLSDIAAAPALGFYCDVFGPSAAYFKEHERSISYWRRMEVSEFEQLGPIIEIEGGSYLDVQSEALLVLTAKHVIQLVNSDERKALDLARNRLNENNDTHVDFCNAFEMYRRKIEDSICSVIVENKSHRGKTKLRFSKRRRLCAAAKGFAKSSVFDVIVDSCTGMLAIPFKAGYTLIRALTTDPHKIDYPQDFGATEMVRRSQIENVYRELQDKSPAEELLNLRVVRSVFNDGLCETMASA